MLALVVAAACTANEPTSGATPTAGPDNPSTSTATPALPATPSPGAPVAESERCAHEERGYALDYPANWRTDECVTFHPVALEGGEPAITLRLRDERFTALVDLALAHGARVHLLTVAGRDAARVAGEGSEIPPGYLLNLGDRTLEAEALATEGLDAATAGEVLDRLLDGLELEPEEDAAANLWRVVDKRYALPDGFAPPDLVALPARHSAPGWDAQLLREEAALALEALLDAAADAGHDIRVRSAYRSYETQVTTFAHWVSVYGEETARRRSAEPGHSEHQLGTVADVTSPGVAWDLDEQWHETPEGQWFHAHAPEYGFALSYPEGGEEITGYIHEPWHWRYIGRAAALEWQESDVTLVEYLEGLRDATPADVAERAAARRD